MQDREQAGDGRGEQRHRLGEAVDRGAPALPGEQQQRGDQRPGIADADPPDVIGDGEAPDHRRVDAPDPDALDEQPGEATAMPSVSSEREAEADPPARGPARRCSSGSATHGDRSRIARHPAGSAAAAAVGVALMRLSSSAGFGLRTSLEVGGARPGAEMAEQRVVMRLLPQAGPAESGWFRSPNRMARVGQADWQAVTTSPSAIGRFSFSAARRARADALDAVGAFLHHAAARARSLPDCAAPRPQARPGWRIPARRHSRRS